jgi:hypothetical protein
MTPALQVATGSNTFISGDILGWNVKAVPVINDNDKSEIEAMQIIINNDLPIN